MVRVQNVVRHRIAGSTVVAVTAVDGLSSHEVRRQTDKDKDGREFNFCMGLFHVANDLAILVLLRLLERTEEARNNLEKSLMGIP